MRDSVSEVTRILDSIAQGDPKAAEELLPLVYEELRHLAAAKMAKEAPGQTLQPTALVHEAWLRLGGTPDAKFANRAHFFAAAAPSTRNAAQCAFRGPAAHDLQSNHHGPPQPNLRAPRARQLENPARGSRR